MSCPEILSWYSVEMSSVLTGDRYIRSHMTLDSLERRARYPAVDKYGRETAKVLVPQAGAYNQ